MTDIKANLISNKKMKDLDIINIYKLSLYQILHIFIYFQ